MERIGEWGRSWDYYLQELAEQRRKASELVSLPMLADGDDATIFYSRGLREVVSEKSTVIDQRKCHHTNIIPGHSINPLSVRKNSAAVAPSTAR